jgi:hypothetical protein
MIDIHKNFYIILLSKLAPLINRIDPNRRYNYAFAVNSFDLQVS